MGCQGIEESADATPDVTWRDAMRAAKSKAPAKDSQVDAMIDTEGKLRLCVRAKVEYPFRVVKR